MGLIKAGLNSIAGTFEEQWKEYFSCEALPNTVLMKRGHKVVGGRASNNGNDNIISNGSKIIIYDGQAAIITDNGKIVDFVNEPGGYEFNKSSQPSIFYDTNIGENVKKSLLEAWERFKFSGQPSNEQKIFFFNTKNVTGIPFGTSAPLPFKYAPVNTPGAEPYDLHVKFNGTFSLKIVNPIYFYQNYTGAREEYRTDTDEFRKTFIPSFIAKTGTTLSSLGVNGAISPSDFTANLDNINRQVDDAISKDWIDQYGIDIMSVGFNAIILPDEDNNILVQDKQYKNKMAMLGGADKMIMHEAASNPGANMMGAMMGAGMGMNFGQQMMGKMQEGQQAQNGWKCNCGAVNQGKFCSECGTPQPQQTNQNEWTCECGTKNTGKFCSNCGKAKS